MNPRRRFVEIKELEGADFGKVPTKQLELSWLYATCAYEQFDTELITDGCWDQLTKYLLKFEARLSPYFRWSVPRDCLVSSTGSGIDWSQGVPNLVLNGVQEFVDNGFC